MDEERWFDVHLLLLSENESRKELIGPVISISVGKEYSGSGADALRWTALLIL